jgi:hypothetical protein
MEQMAYPSLPLKFLSARRHHVHPASLQKAFKTAVKKACITKNASYSKTQLRDTFIGKWL